MGWNDLSQDVRDTIEHLDTDMDAILEEGSIAFSDRTINTLTSEDNQAIREFTLDLLCSARRTLLESGNDND